MRTVGRRRLRKGANAVLNAIGGMALRRGNQFPPPVVATKTVSVVNRYIALSGNTIIVTVNDLLDHLFCAASSSPTYTGYRLISSLKVKKIEIWAPAINGEFTASANNLISFSWGQSASGQDVGQPTRIVSDVSVGTNDAPHLCVVPPPNSVQSMWQSSQANTDVFFWTEQPQGSVMDIHLTYTLFDGAAGSAGLGFAQGGVQAPIAGPVTAGLVYQRTLPGNSTTGWTPFQGATA